MRAFTALHKSSILFSRNINLTSRRLEFRTTLTFFAIYFLRLLLIKISLGVHLLFGIDSVIKNLLKVLNIYKKGSSPAFEQLEVQGIQFAATPATPQVTPRLFMLNDKE